MEVKLLKAARIRHEAGEIVTVSPEVGRYLLSMKMAENAEKEQPKKTKKK